MFLRMFILLMVLTSCSTPTILIKNSGSAKAVLDQREEWHHDAVFGLVEGSSAVNLKERCPHGWENVSVSKPFRHFFVGTFNPFLFMYDPWSVTYQCRAQ